MRQMWKKPKNFEKIPFPKVEIICQNRWSTYGCEGGFSGGYLSINTYFCRYFPSLVYSLMLQKQVLSFHNCIITQSWYGVSVYILLVSWMLYVVGCYMLAKPCIVISHECKKATLHFHCMLVRLDTWGLMEE